MAQNIIGRTKEKRELSELYHSGRPEFVVVQGRRRIGKTFLVREMFEGKFAFYHTGLSPAETKAEDNATLQRQLEMFYSSLVRYGYEGIMPKSWLQAFDDLIGLLEKTGSDKRQLVFIDEMPWMDTPRSGFIPAFEHFWNGWGAGKCNLMLVVCGSATSWIGDKILNNKGGLFNRTTFEIRLRPFTLKECADFYKERQIVMDQYDQLQAYMIMGGIPYYMSLLRKEWSLAQNVDELFFAKDAKLRIEFDRLFNSLFANPELNKDLIRHLGKKRSGLTRTEIMEKVGLMSGGRLSDMLRMLEASDFITTCRSYKGAVRDTRYILTDAFCLFYLYFMDKNKTTNERFWQDNLHSASLNAWRGYAFERVCFSHVWQIKNALGISGVQTEVMPWRSKQQDDGAQIDMVIDRDDRVINICEMKFCRDDFTITKSYDKELRHKLELFSNETKTRKALHLTLVTTYGVSRNEYSGKVQNVVTMDDLIK
jgi:AAA+ ATPase superfamily predicted ATPase